MKQLKTDLIVLCDYALISQEGKLSINGIFDELRVQKFPGGFIDKYLVATIHGEPNTPYKLDVKLEKKNTEKNLLNPTSISPVTSANGKNNLVIRLANVGFEKEGEYRFVIYDGKNEVGSTLLRVMLLELGQLNQEIYKMPN